MSSQTFQELVADGVLAIGDGYRAKNSELGGDGPIFLRAAYLQDGGFINDMDDRFRTDLDISFGPKRAQIGDVVITTKGNSTGRLGVIRSEQAGAIYSPHLSYWRSVDHDVLDQQFLTYWAHGREFTNQLKAMAYSTDMAPYLSLRDQLRVEISLPKIEDQRRVASCLQPFDDKIELNRRMNETLEEMARALFRDWFVDFGPTRRQMEGETSPAAIMGHAFPPEKATTLAPLFPTKLGDKGLPEGWSDQPLSELTSLLKRGAAPKYAEAGCLVVNQKCIRNNAINYKLARRNDLSLRDPKLKELQVGDVLVNSTGVGTLGRVATVRVLPERAMADTHVSIVRPDPDLIAPSIVALLLETMQDRIADMGHGSTGQTELKPSVIGEINVTIATPEIQEAFDKTVSVMRQKVDANQQENQTLAEMRDLLLPKLMSGDIRLKDAEAAP